MSICWVYVLGALSLIVTSACSSPPARDVNEANDPFALVRTADQLASVGDYDEATRRYLVALDEGREHDSAFVAARGEVVRKLVELGLKYPPAQAALANRTHLQSQRILAAAEGGASVEAMDLSLFVLLGFSSGNEAEVRATSAVVKARLGPSSRVRIGLSGAFERYLVDRRRYLDALAESDAAVIDYYLDLFRLWRNDERVRPAIAFTIANECGAHFEALLGVGRRTEADLLADKLTEYVPTSSTFVSLIQRAQRVGAAEAISRLRERANAMGAALPADVPAI